MTFASLFGGDAASDVDARPAASLTRIEAAFLVVVPIVAGLLALVLGKDADWDFANYHWYNAYALLNGRLGFDVAVAAQPTYYNPLIDVPYYWLAKYGASWLAVFSIGLVEGLNVVPLFFIARASLAPDLPHRRLVVMGLALVGVCGATAISMIGRVTYDNVLSVPVLGGLAVLLCNPKSARATFFAGLLFGAAAGMKLVEMFYCIGFAAALLVVPGDLRSRAIRIGAGAAGGVIGVALFATYWAWALWHATGNPFFPYFNSVFQSPLVAAADFSNPNFLPDNFLQALFFPFIYTWDHTKADDVPFRDIFFVLAYTAIFVSLVFWALRRIARDAFIDREHTAILFVFTLVSYAAWLAEFSVHRYIVALEMLSPTLIVAAVGLLPLRQAIRAIAVAVVLVVALAGGDYRFGARSPLGDPYVRLTSPLVIPHPDNTIVLISGNMPLAYLIPSLPPQIPVLRISSFMTAPDDHSLMTARMRARADAHTGDVYTLASEFEMDWAKNDAKAYGFVLDPATCAQFSTDLGGPYRFCPLTRAHSAGNGQ